MGKHIAIIHVPFTVDSDFDPSEEADEIVRDIHSRGFDNAHLEDVVDVAEGISSPSKRATDAQPTFTRRALECGHGDDFSAVFVMTSRCGGYLFHIESVDLIMIRDGESVCIGAVGGELNIAAARREDGSVDLEQTCRDWIGAWHRHFVGQCEDSVHGLFLMIKQVISEGTFSKE